MRKTLSSIAVTGIAILAVTGTAQAATTPVQSLSGDFTASNSTVVKTPDGVHFGTYADGGAVGGSVMWKGANGLQLKDVTDSRTSRTRSTTSRPGTPAVRLRTPASGSTRTATARPITP